MDFYAVSFVVDKETHSFYLLPSQFEKLFLKKIKIIAINVIKHTQIKSCG